MLEKKINDKPKSTQNLREGLRSYGVILALVLLIVLISVLQPTFLSPTNIRNLLRQMSVLTILSLGLTSAMIVGEVDLSFGEVAGLSGVVATLLLLNHFNLYFTILLVILLGTGFGLMNGLISVEAKVPSFIATIATMSLAIGINFLLTHGRPVYGDFPRGFNSIGTGFFLGIPMPVIIMLLTVLIAWLITARMAIGRYMYATGGNIIAAFHSGIRVNLFRILGLTLSGTCAAIGGIILAARLGSGQPTAGSSFLLDGFAVVFLGSTVGKEGLPNVLGTFIGAMVLAVLNNGMTLLGMPYEAENIVKALVLIGAVALARLGARAIK